MIRKRLNQRLLGQLASAPGTDPRTWLAYGRVDDDEDAIRWNDEEDGPVGWVVDVTFVGGPLDGEGPIACRYGAGFSGADALRSDPISQTCLVVVSIPGNANEDCTIVATLPTLGCEPPTEVNGEEMTEERALSTHFLKTPHSVDEEIGGDRRVKTTGANRVLGENVELAEEGATKSFVRGEDLETAVNGLADALNVLSVAIGAGFTAITPAGGGPAIGTTFGTALTAFQTSLAQFKASSSNYKSTRIKGE